MINEGAVAVTSDMSDVLKEYFGIYAKYVIGERAIPDIRDGLKPVHRRLIYAAFNMGAKQPNKAVKCAKIVGETMGNFHPHGDKSIYDTLVRMTQEFAMRIPLFEGQGNFGSIDGDPPAAMRYCIVGNSRVKTDRGLLKIEDIIDNDLNSTQEIDLKVLSKNKIENSASLFFNSGFHKTYLLETQEGFEIEGSGNHPVLTLCKDKTGEPIYVWKFLQEISSKDIVVIDRSEKNIGKVKASKTEKDIALITGCLVSEGFVSKGKQRIGFNNTDKQYFDDFISAWRRVFGKNFYTNQRKLKSGKVLYEFDVQLQHSKDEDKIKNHVIYKALCDLKSENQRIPDFIFRMPKDAQRCFLQYLFEGDGSVSKSKNTISLQYNSKSKFLVKDVLVLLLEFGVIGRISPSKKTAYKVSIGSLHNIIQFKKAIGFSNNKNILLNKFIAEETERREKEPVFGLSNDVVPYLSDYLRNNCNSSCFIAKRNIDRRERIEQYASEIKDCIKDDVLEFFSNIVDNRYYYASVKSCKKQPKEKIVYSIRVDSDCHSFVANGFINHNTEARLFKIAQELFCNNLNSEVVRFVPNYDESTVEPEVLPSELPHLLLNYNSGIAVGLATEILSCSAHEIIDCLIGEIKEELITKHNEFAPKQFKGPDLPTAGIMEFNKSALNALWLDGRSTWKTRGEAVFETDERTGTKRVVVTSLPFQQQKDKWIEETAGLVVEKTEDGQPKIQGITDIRDESNKNGIRTVFDVHHSFTPDIILASLYKNTKLSKNLNTGIVATVEGKPKYVGVREVLLRWLDFRRDCLRNILKKEKREKEERAEIVDGFLIVHKNIDKVIKTIRESEDAKAALISEFALTDRQAVSVVAMRLGSLRKIDNQVLEDERKNLQERIDAIVVILADPKKIDGLIADNLEEWKTKLDGRKTKIVREFGEISTLDTIVDRDVVVAINGKQEFKVTNVDSYRKVRRGGKGVKETSGDDPDDVPVLLAQVTTHDMLYAFTDKSRVFEKACHELPITKRSGKRQPLSELFSDLQEDESVVAIMAMNIMEMPEDATVVMIRSNGNVKRLQCRGLLKKRGRLWGDECCRVDLDDSKLVSVTLAEPNKDFIAFTKNGLYRRISLDTLRPLPSRQSGASKCLTLVGDDVVIGVDTVKEGDAVFSVSENGYGARFNESVLNAKKGRVGKGCKLANADRKAGKIVYGGVLNEDHELFVTTSGGKTIRLPANQIKETGRGTRGVRVQRMGEGERIVAATRIEVSNESEE